jgi:hypothetical protein
VVIEALGNDYTAPLPSLTVDFTWGPSGSAWPFSGAKLNFMLLHVEPAYLSQFHGFTAPVVNYALHVSGIHLPRLLGL